MGAQFQLVLFLVYLHQCEPQGWPSLGKLCFGAELTHVSQEQQIIIPVYYNEFLMDVIRKFSCFQKSVITLVALQSGKVVWGECRSDTGIRVAADPNSGLFRKSVTREVAHTAAILTTKANFTGRPAGSLQPLAFFWTITHFRLCYTQASKILCLSQK